MPPGDDLEGNRGLYTEEDDQVRPPKPFSPTRKIKYKDLSNIFNRYSAQHKRF